MPGYGDDPMAMDGWDPELYGRFAAERAQPFFDLVTLLRPVPGAHLVDLGCGTGELTAALHAQCGAARTLGIERSAAMLAGATGLASDGLVFEQGLIEAFAAPGAFDVVFANASLHWVPDHPSLFRTLTDALRPGGQLAVQVPANGDHPAQALITETAAEPQFAEACAAVPKREVSTHILRPESYAELLDSLGYQQQIVRLQVYVHRLPSTSAAADFTEGTTLVPWRARLAPAVYRKFVARYRERLLSTVGDRSPYCYTFKRILLWAVRPEGEAT